MRINHNIAALNTYRQLSAASTAQSKSMEKLSSGLRINRAGDDAAGLAISEKMRGQIRGLEQASRNAQDGISLIQTAEGALNETHSILQRMRELAVQSANDTATESDRKEIQKEMDQLIEEIDRIGNTTEFNTKTLLNGGVGTSLVSSNSAALKGVSTTSDTKSGVYTVDFTAATRATLTSNAIATASGITNAQIININGTSISLSANDTLGEVASKINAVSNSTGVRAAVQQNTAAGSQRLVLETIEFGSEATINISSETSGVSLSNIGLSSVTTLSAAGTDATGTINGATAVGKGNTLTLKGTTNNAEGLTVEAVNTDTAATVSIDLGSDANAVTATGNIYVNGVSIAVADADTMQGLVDKINAKSAESGVTASLSGTTLTLTSMVKGDNASVTLEGDGTVRINSKNFTSGNDGVQSDTGSSNINNSLNDGVITVNKDNVLKMQIGANEDQNMEVSINDMRATALGVQNIDVTTQAGANDSITTINKAIEKVSAERSKLGAYQNRLEHTINNLGTSAENLTASESRIRDVDMAKEMMEQTKNSILAQAAQAMLAQSNQLPQGVLQLLR